jgi:DNA invertase Pin-like site-specific DNA recombinase
MGKWYYYIRVSTKSQNLDRQEYNKKLDEFCDRMNLNNQEIIILSEKETGKNFERPQYQLLKQVINPGDNIIVSSIDRFGRNYISGRKEFADFISKGVKVYVLDRPMLENLYKLDDSMSKFMINFLVDWELMNAEEELKRIHQRQKEGIVAAKAKNKKFGRPKVKAPENFEEVYREWKNGTNKLTAVEAMRKLNLKKSTFYKLVEEYESGKLIL